MCPLNTDPNTTVGARTPVRGASVVDFEKGGDRMSLWTYWKDTTTSEAGARSVSFVLRCSRWSNSHSMNYLNRIVAGVFFEQRLCIDRQIKLWWGQK
jgi:hypothetical protein